MVVSSSFPTKSRGLDIFELVPSEYLSENEIAAAKSVSLEYLNTQGQPKYIWPDTFSLARAYIDQLERSGGLSTAMIEGARKGLSDAENGTGSTRKDALSGLSQELRGTITTGADADKVRMLEEVIDALVAE
jgi:hypothetical protein